MSGWGWLEFRSVPQGSAAPASRDALRQALADIPGIAAISHASPTQEWPEAGLGHVPRHPRLRGWPIVSAYLNRDLQPKVHLFPVPADSWTPNASSEFASVVLSLLRAWLLKELAKSETQLFEPIQLVVEWTGHAFLDHEVVMRGRPWP